MEGVGDEIVFLLKSRLKKRKGLKIFLKKYFKFFFFKDIKKKISGCCLASRLIKASGNAMDFNSLWVRLYTSDGYHKNRLHLIFNSKLPQHPLNRLDPETMAALSHLAVYSSPSISSIRCKEESRKKRFLELLHSRTWAWVFSSRTG